MRQVPHDWLDAGLSGRRQRWCVTPYAKGGCGAYQIFTRKGCWEPRVAHTCSEQNAGIARSRRERRAATDRHRGGPLWFWNWKTRFSKDADEKHL
jgi:hypothetical protein